MKHNAKYLTLECLVSLSLSLSLLPACGTEIGNGRTAPTKPTNNTDTESGKANSSPLPDASETTSGSTGSVSVPVGSSSFLYVIEACSSPVQEMVSSTWTDQLTTKLDFTVALSSSTWTISVDGSGYSIQANATTATPFGIKATSGTLGTDSCTQTSTTSTASGSTRTATFTSGYKTSWTLNTSNKVTAIKVVNASGTTVGSWIVDP